MFVIQNKGPLLKTSQNCSESLMVFTFTAAANKMHHLYGKDNAVTIQFSLLKCSDAGDTLNGSQFSQQKLDEHRKNMLREFKKSL